MLIKEYRIPLPLTVEEYRIAQLYMIAKKSRDESKGAENGIEILTNEPYENGPGGSGQYTHKIYHIASHLPGWFKSLLPISRLAVEERAWNAYPYTKTCYSCPLVQRFSLEIETYYFADGGTQENVFKLKDSELRNRTVDIIDIVKDQLVGADYVKEEDPTLYVSQKTMRGPLADNWIAEYSKECQGKTMPLPNGKAIMTAYKLCKVELHIWGMQTKLENYIHSVGLRKTMLRAHRQAWAWQDEWVNLSMDDIREIERQTQESLKRKMAGESDFDESEEEEVMKTTGIGDTIESIENVTISSQSSTYTLCEEHPLGSSPTDPCQTILSETSNSNSISWDFGKPRKSKSRSRASSNATVYGAMIPNTVPKNLELLTTLRVESLMCSQSESESEDEFFDCVEIEEATSLNKWSSMENMSFEDAEAQGVDTGVEDSIFSQPFLQRITAEREKLNSRKISNKMSIDEVPPGSPTVFSSTACRTTVLCLVFHAGSVLDSGIDIQAKKSDVTTFKGAFESVVRQHYPSMMGHVAIKLVSCPAICTEALGVLTSLSPYSFDVYGSGDSPQMTNEAVPIGAMPLFATSQPEYWDAVSKAAGAANQVYQEFLSCESGQGFNGQVVVIGDSMGSVLAYDVLSKSQHLAEEDLPPSPASADVKKGVFRTASFRRRSSSSVSDSEGIKLDFEVTDLFIFGSPLAMVLAHRKMHSEDKNMTLTRPCHQLYNLFHPTDPLAIRMEPLISASFAAIAPVNVARYSKYPLGDGQPYHLLSQKWWGNKRIDYALYCPESLANFPTNALPHLFHASYWESADAIAFILRQVAVHDPNSSFNRENKEARSFCPPHPREKWLKKRTAVKLKNLSANHRANDVIVLEGQPVTFKARFMYGPLDMVSLSGEKVDIYIMKDPTSSDWAHIAEEVVDKNGRICHTLSADENLSYGFYPVKMIVRGDHTCVDFYCAIVPPKTECVVFSIDGSFTASMSVSGRDPRVRPGAVDVTRHWQELGFLIIYVTGRPDMQHHRVVSWLAQHNFPHGLVSFADGFSTDFLAHKTEYLRNLVNEQGLLIHAAYGSSKDIAVYSSVGVRPEQIFIIGKVSKKLHNLATVLSEGYSEHLTALMSHGGSRPAHGNARMVLPRGYLGLPGQSGIMRRQRSVKRSAVFPPLPNEVKSATSQDQPRDLSPSPRLIRNRSLGAKLMQH